MTNRINQVFVLLLLGLLPAHYASAQVADIPGDGSTTTRLFAPGIFSSDIASATDQDVLRVRLISGGAYQIDAAATSDTLDPRIALYPPGQSAFGDCTGSAGVLVANDNIEAGVNNNSRITHTATQTGDHLLCADGAGATTGNYRLTATVTSAPPPQPRATISAPDTFITVAETALGGTTLTVTLENTAYEPSPMAAQFTLNLIPVATGVTVGGVVRDSATAATLTLAYTDSTGINANTRIGVTVLDAAHTGSGDLTTDNMLRVVATAPSFAGMQPIANQVYLANSAITDLTLPAAGGGEGTLSYSLAPNPPNGLAFDADTRILSGTPDTPQAATGYTYTVTAGDGNTATRSFTIEILNPATGLTAVRELAATERRGRVRRIALTWLPPATVPDGTSVSSYEIQGCSAADTDCVAFITSNHDGDAGASQIATLFRATFNFYRVRARTAAGVSPWANVALTVDPGVVVDPEDLPSMVQNLASSALADNSVTLTWEAPTDATDTAVNRYVVVRGFPAETATLGAFAPPGAEAVVTLAADVFTYADSGLLPGTEYLYEVFASSNAGDGEVAQLLATTTGTLTTSIAGENTGAITEGSTDSITGTLTITTTSGNSEFVPAFVPVDPTLLGGFNGAYGVFAIGTDGVWTYSLNYNLPRVRALTASQMEQDTFTVTAAAPTADGVAVTQVVTITITGVNTRPNAAIQLIDGSTVAAGETLRLESDITDPDNDLGELTIEWTAAGGIGTFSAAASADTDWMVPDSTPPDEYVLTLTVTDPGSASDTEQVSITVTAAAALDFGGETIDDQIYTMGAAITDLTLPVASGGTAPYSYALSGMPSGLNFDGDTRVLSGTPNAVQAATTYTYTATDAASPPGTGTLAFTIEVAALVPTVGGDLTGTATPLLIDAAGNTVSGGTASGTLVVSNVPSGVTPSHRIETDAVLGELTVDSVTGAWSYQIDNSRPATRAFRPSQGTTDSGVIITTLGVLEITSTVRITIGAGSFPDDPPTATAMVNGIDGGGTAEASSTVTLSGAGSDPEGSAITGYAWAQTGGTTVVLAPDASTAEVTFTAPASPETLAFTLTVMTATQTSPALSVAVEVTAAPLGFGGETIDPQIYTMGAGITDLTLPVASGGTGPYSYALSDMPSGLAFDSDTRVLSGTPDTAQAATTYTYTATDMASPPATVMQSFTIEVAAAATAAITASNPASLTEANLDGATLTVTLTGTTYMDPLPANPVTLNTEATNNGLTVMAARGGDTEATLTLTYDGTDFDTDFDIIVTVTDAAHTGTGDIDTATVPVTAVDESDVATLSALTLSGGATLTPDFDAGTFTYTADVDNSVANIMVTPTATDDGATIEVQGTAVTSGSASTAITLTAGMATDIDVLVTAEDGSTTRTYNLAVTRVAAALGFGGVTIDDQTYTMDTGITDLTLPVATGGTGPYSYALSDMPSGLVFDSDARVLSGTPDTAQVATTYTYTATDMASPPATVMQSFTIEVAAAATAAITASNPASLTEANLGGATLTVTLTDTTYVNTLPANPVTLNTAATAAGVTVMTVVRDTATAATVTLAYDDTDFDADLDIIVTVAAVAHAGSGDLLTAARTVTATVETSRLSALSLSEGALDPVFNAGTFAYAASVANSIDGLTVTPTAAAGTTITVDSTPVNSGAASAELALTVGTNTITVAVTAPRADAQDYTLTVTRAQPVTFAATGTTGGVTEDAPTDTATGTLDVTNPNPSGGTEVVAQTDTDGTYGMFSIVADTRAWTYMLDNANSATNALAAGETVTDTFPVVAAADPSAMTSVVITITGANDAPLADAGDNQPVAVDAVVTLDGSASADPDTGADPTNADTIETYAWTQDSGTAVTLSDPAVAMPTFTAPDSAATLVFSLVVSDGDLDSAAATVTITVTAAPAATISATNPTTLTEDTLDNAMLTVTLVNTTYVDSLPDNSITLNTDATTVGVMATAVRVSDTEATLTLAFDRDISDFDTNLDITVTVLAAAHTGAGDLLTGTETVTAIAESDVATLAGLTLSGSATLNETFAPNTLTYTADVANDVTDIMVTPTATDATGATITVNSIAVNSGAASGAIALTAGGATDITVVVTAEDGVATQTYTLTVTRAAAVVPMADIPGDGTTTARLMVPGTFSSNIDGVGDLDGFLVGLISGGTYQIDAETTSGTLNTLIVLFPPGQVDLGSCSGGGPGTLIANDGGGSGTDSRITWTATQTGDHLLCVRTITTGLGNYQLTAAVTSEPPTPPRATISAPPDTSIPIAEAALNGTTLTVTLESTEYEPSPTAGQFTLNLSAGTGVTVGGVVRDSATAATLTLAYTGSTGINANTRIGVTVLDAAHTGSGDLTTDNMLRVAATAPSFAGMPPIANQVYLADSAITDLTLPAASGGEGTLSYTLAPNPPNGLMFDADTRVLSGTPDTEQAATGYTYTVTAGDGNTATRSFTIEILNLATGLTAVRDLVATERRGRVRRIALTWLPPATVPVGTVSSYEIQGCSAADTDCVAFITSNHIGAADASQSATLFRATFNFYRVRARTAAGVSPWANVALVEDPGVVVDPGNLPSMVQNLMSSALADNSVTLTWAAPTDATSTAVNRYVVVRGFPAETATLGAFAPPGAEAVVTLAADVFTYADSGLLPGTEYLYEVFASSNAGDGEVVQLLVTTTGTLTTSIAGDDTGAITEGSTDSITGTLTITTTSGNSEFVAQINSEGEEQLQFSAYGMFTISAAGVWTYSLNYTLPRVRALSAGQSVEDTFTVTAAAPTADGVAVTHTVTITVTGVNTRPFAAIRLIDGSTVVAGETISLESIITDQDDDLSDLTIAWTAATGIGTFSDAASADTDWTPNISILPGVYILTLTVTDPGGASDTEQVSITVTAAPLGFGTASVADQNYPLNIAITDLTLPVAVGGTGPYSYALSGMPSGLAFDGDIRVLSGAPDTVQAATTYTYTATDSASPPAMETLEFTIAVAEATATISATSPGPLTEANLNGAMLTVTLAGSVTYEDTLPADSITLNADATTAGVTATAARVSDTQARLTLAFNRVTSDFDDNLDIIVTVLDAAHTGTGDLVTLPIVVEAVVESSDATLAGLTLSGAATLNETFAPGTLSYTADVASTVATIMVTPTATDAGATITVDSTAVTSGMASGAIDLNAGTNTITVEVTAGDGSTQTYTLTVTRAQPSDALSFVSATIPAQTYTMGTAITDLTLPAATGGTAPYSYTLSDVPSGLSFDGDTRVLSGTPDMEQMATTYTYTATDSALSPGPAAVTLSLVITVEPAEVTGEQLEGARREALEMTLGAFGRSFASSAVEVLDERFSSGAGGSQLTFGGRTLSLESLTNGQAAANAGAGPDNQPVSAATGGQQTSVGALFAGSAFQLSLNEGDAAGVGATTLWARGSVGNYEGEPEDGFQLDGDIVSGYLGLDYRANRRTLVGVAVSHSRGDADFSSAEIADGEVETELTSILPYVQWQARPGLSVWGLVGYGLGESEITDSGESRKTDVEMQTAALGARGKLWSKERMDVALKASALTVEIESDSEQNLSSVSTRAHRLRMALAGKRHGAASAYGDHFNQRFELGLRWDGGDVETGVGADLGAGVEYAAPGSGTRLRLDGHYLLVHEESDFEEWEVSAAISIDPGVRGRGVTFALEPNWESTGARQRMVMDFTNVLGPAWRDDGLKLELYGEHAEEHEFGLEGSFSY